MKHYRIEVKKDGIWRPAPYTECLTEGEAIRLAVENYGPHYLKRVHEGEAIVRVVPVTTHPTLLP